MYRKIVKIIVRRVGSGFPSQLIALCDDGTAWVTSSQSAMGKFHQWTELPTIPPL